MRTCALALVATLALLGCDNEQVPAAGQHAREAVRHLGEAARETVESTSLAWKEANDNRIEPMPNEAPDLPQAKADTARSAEQMDAAVEQAKELAGELSDPDHAENTAAETVPPLQTAGDEHDAATR